MKSMEIFGKFKRYRPLAVLVLLTILESWALVYDLGDGLFEGTHYFMGLFFCQFAMLKLFHLEGFVEGFRKYDLLAMRVSGYGYVYPFIELFLGLAYLAFVFPVATYVITIVVTLISAIGVIKALRKGLNVKCACMGTILDVPLSTVTLSEDIVMGVMAVSMLVLQLV